MTQRPDFQTVNQQCRTEQTAYSPECTAVSSSQGLSYQFSKTITGYTKSSWDKTKQKLHASPYFFLIGCLVSVSLWLPYLPGSYFCSFLGFPVIYPWGSHGLKAFYSDFLLMTETTVFVLNQFIITGAAVVKEFPEPKPFVTICFQQTSGL